MHNNNPNNMPNVDGQICDLCSSTRKAFLAIQKAYATVYSYEGNETIAFMTTMEKMMNLEYCDAVIAEKFTGAKGVAAIGRATIIAMRPFFADLSDALINLDRNVNYLEIAIEQANR